MQGCSVSRHIDSYYEVGTKRQNVKTNGDSVTNHARSNID